MLSPKSYKGLEAYNLSKKLVIACYELTHEFPEEEKTNFTRHIRTAALSLHVSIVQGVFLNSKKRKKFVRAAKHALIIIDAACEMVVELKMATQEQIEVIASYSSLCFQLMDAL